MSRRVALGDRQVRVLAWGLLAVAVAMLLGVIVFAVLGWGSCSEEWRAASATGDRACRILTRNNDLGGASEGIGFAVMGLLFAALGAVLASRRRGNALGWLFLATGLVAVANAFTTTYTIHTSEAPGSLPAAMPIAVLSEILGGPIVFAPFVLFFLLFPNGRVLSRPWRLAVAAVGVFVVAQSLSLGLHPRPLRLAPLSRNPLGLDVLSGGLAGVIDTAAFSLLLLALAASVVSLVLRFRRSRGVERQQMKWFTTSSAFVGLTFVLGPLFWSVPELEVLWGPLFLLSTVSVPVAATIAILRYRLYDLDVIVNRALVYGALTGLLASIYLGMVMLLQAALSGRGGGSDIAVATSTLMVAALFRPVRRRIQSFIDHRFYRRKYNALQTVATFSAQLRQETDLGALRGELLTAVHKTIQPAQALVWIKEDRTA